MNPVPELTREPDALAAPIDGEAFAALMETFAPFASRLAIAVSGGPDSMALAYCVKRWASASPKILALIVDHGLRAESAQEAAQTKKVLTNFGIGTEILPWQHAPVVTRLHENARKARYKLLCDACRTHGIRDLLLAHHREDQAETILMRLAKGSGVDGLAGMGAINMLEGVRLLRPFLSIPKNA